MIENFVRDIATRFGLGDQARPLVQMVLAYLTNPASGGLSGVLDRLRSGGHASLVDSWVSDTETPETPTDGQVETMFGSPGGLLATVVARLGLSREKVTQTVGALLPMLISYLTPGGRVPAALPADVTAFASEGRSLLGAALTGAGAAATAPPVVPPVATAAPAASSGIGKWLPWLIGALVVIFGISYCSKKTATEAPPPASTTVPAPSESPSVGPATATDPAPAASMEPAPAPAPAPAPEASAPVADTFTAPAGAGVLDAMVQDVPMLRVFFDTGKTEVAPEFADRSKALVDYVKANPDAKAVISGFNDPTGDPVKNAELSKHRAQAVQSALVAAGVPQDSTVLEKPAETTDTGATNASSRRVDVVLRK
ncbi:YidB family protein [Diaphorobacter sp.]|uniref:YidB family protein n=1 Tax=Diaphorobacter sp. TaxID=1934310 RepID=UPI0028AFAB10|nr:YidB family protein [Diaphorobacter sp.]